VVPSSDIVTASRSFFLAPPSSPAHQITNQTYATEVALFSSSFDRAKQKKTNGTDLSLEAVYI
jgi:hypothetical protein